ncbi:MAG: hypothetical protein PHF67_02530 [Candidatus Nanoarchaeia archaeon]|nr:hypothetical protein [Candidatus Nanoarchaeia archaeon]
MAKKGSKKEEAKKNVIENTEVKDNALGENTSKENVNLTNNTELKEIQNPPETAKRQNKQVVWAIVLMVLVILIILLTPYIMKNYVNKFTYIDLDFYKTKMGDITFYSTNIPLTDKNMNLISEYPLNLRNDPRKLDEIPYKFPAEDSIINDDNNDSSQIIFKKSQTVYISIQADAPKCEDNLIAVVGFTQFLKEFANMSIKAATDDKDYANETGYPYVTCNNYPTNTVIHLVSGNSTELIKLDQDCYQLIYKDCEITQITERFMLEILRGYMQEFMKYFNRYGILGWKS